MDFNRRRRDATVRSDRIHFGRAAHDHCNRVPIDEAVAGRAGDDVDQAGGRAERQSRAGVAAGSGNGATEDVHIAGWFADRGNPRRAMRDRGWRGGGGGRPVPRPSPRTCARFRGCE